MKEKDPTMGDFYDQMTILDQFGPIRAQIGQ